MLTVEDPDTIIPLHVFDIVNHDSYEIDVFSPDTDIFILLIDFVSSHQVNNEVNFVTGHGCSNRRKTNINEECRPIGVLKAIGLLGLHAYTGGGKFVGISKVKWLKVYLNLQCGNDIITAFEQLGGT